MATISTTSSADQPPQPFWLRRNLSLLRERNAIEEGCYAEILCNYQILAVDAKAAVVGGTGAVANNNGGGASKVSVTPSPAPSPQQQQDLARGRSPSISHNASPPSAPVEETDVDPATTAASAVASVTGSFTDGGADRAPSLGGTVSGGGNSNNDRLKVSNVVATAFQRTINNFTRSENNNASASTSNNFNQNNAAAASSSSPPHLHGDVHSTIRELSNELDRARGDLHEKQNTIGSIKAARDRLESQVSEVSGKLVNATLANNKLQRDAEKREEMINILKNEREGFMSENEALRKKASDAAREANKYRGDLMSWKDVEIGLRQQVFELESVLAAIRREEQQRQQQKPPSSPGGGLGSDFVDIEVPPRQQQNGNNGTGNSPTDTLSVPAATGANSNNDASRNRLGSFIDSFLSFGKPYNAATNNAAMQHEAMQRQQREKDNEATFTTQTAAFLGTDVSRGHTAAASIPTFASFVVEKAHEGDLQALCFTESAKHVWTGGAEKALKCWDVNGNGRLVVRLPCSGGFPLSLHSVGDVLAVGCSDATIRVMETTRYHSKCQLTGHSDKVTTAILSPDAYKVYSTATDRTIKRWHVSRELAENTIMCISGCNDIAVCNDKMASAHHDGTVRIWDCRDCKTSGEVKDVHEKAISTVRWVGEGMMVASMGRDDSIKISDIRTMRVVKTYRDPQLRVASNLQRFDISSDGRYLCVGAANGNLLFFNTDTGTILSDPDSAVGQRASAPKVITGGHNGYIMNVAWNPEGKGVVTVGSDKKLAYWR